MNIIEQQLEDDSVKNFCGISFHRGPSQIKNGTAFVLEKCSIEGGINFAFGLVIPTQNVVFFTNLTVDAILESLTDNIPIRVRPGSANFVKQYSISTPTLQNVRIEPVDIAIPRKRPSNDEPKASQDSTITKSKQQKTDNVPPVITATTIATVAAIIPISNNKKENYVTPPEDKKESKDEGETPRFRLYRHERSEVAHRGSDFIPNRRGYGYFKQIDGQTPANPPSSQKNLSIATCSTATNTDTTTSTTTARDKRTSPTGRSRATTNKHFDSRRSPSPRSHSRHHDWRYDSRSYTRDNSRFSNDSFSKRSNMPGRFERGVYGHSYWDEKHTYARNYSYVKNSGEDYYDKQEQEQEEEEGERHEDEDCQREPERDQIRESQKGEGIDEHKDNPSTKEVEKQAVVAVENKKDISNTLESAPTQEDKKASESEDEQEDSPSGKKTIASLASTTTTTTTTAADDDEGEDDCDDNILQQFTDF